MIYQLSFKSITPNLIYHPETKNLPKKSIFSSGDLDIWLFDPIFKPTLAYPLSYPYIYQLSFKTITPKFSYHPETKQLSKISIYSNSDLEIWPFGTIFNPTLGYPLSYSYTNFHSRPSFLTSVIIRKLPRTDRRTDRRTPTNTIVPSGFRQGTNKDIYRYEYSWI